jgi:Flp pilus assembly protein TadG
MRDEKGSVVIEVALALPLILAVIFGFIGLNQMIHDSMAIQTAAREGARHYAIYHNVEDAIEIAERELEAANVKNAVITVTHRPPNDRGMIVQKIFALRIPFGEIKLFNIRREIILHQVP